MDSTTSPSRPRAASNSHPQSGIMSGRHASQVADMPRSRSDESWIEVSSRPSSSSLSSAADEIITTGLRIQQEVDNHRRRRSRRGVGSSLADGSHGQRVDAVRQEEYEESESESDRVMASSNEAILPSPLQNEWRPGGAHFTLSSASSENAYGSEDADDDDENATAIGAPRREQTFTPQPNAFSHPPTANRFSAQQHSMNSYFEQRPARPTQRSSYNSREQHSPYNMHSPSHQVDHDAALRASLSTLLSCAAAARGLPKSNNQTAEARRPTTSNQVDPTTIGLIPESAIFGPTAPGPATQSGPRVADAGPANADKSKRKATVTTTATTQRSSSKDRRAAKKVRRTASNWTPATMEEVNPTVLTWFVGAGIVVLVSALSFSAGYITGKEAGRAEMLELGNVDAGRCGKEAVISGASRSLRRLRWTDAASSIIV